MIIKCLLYAACGSESKLNLSALEAMSEGEDEDGRELTTHYCVDENEGLPEIKNDSSPGRSVLFPLPQICSFLSNQRSCSTNYDDDESKNDEDDANDGAILIL